MNVFYYGERHTCIVASTDVCNCASKAYSECVLLLHSLLRLMLGMVSTFRLWTQITTSFLLGGRGK